MTPVHLEFDVAVPQAEITLKVPMSIRSSEAAIHFYVDHFSPPYWALNWDSMADWLSDLSWIGENRICIFHEGIPELESIIQTQCYLDVLNDAVKRHSERKTHVFRVIFPPNCRELILAQLAS